MSENEEDKAKVTHVIVRSGRNLVTRPSLITSEIAEQNASGEGRTNKIWTLLENWPNLDVWSFRGSSMILGVAAALTGFHLNSTFRSALLLTGSLKATTYLGLMGVSGFSSGVLHFAMISDKILQITPNKNPPCLVCMQVQAAVAQVGCGLVYPMIFAPLMTYTVASSFKERHLPKLYKKPKEVGGFFKSIYAPLQGRLSIIAGLHVVLAMGMTYLEQECYFSKILPVIEGREPFIKKPDPDQSGTSFWSLF